MVKSQKPIVKFGNAFELTQPEVSPATISNFTYSKLSNVIPLLYFYSKDVFGYTVDPTKSALKVYQDILIIAFIEQNIPYGSKILDVGGGDSRVLKYLQNHYETWLIDEFKGLGSGPKTIPKHLKESSINVIQSFMGSFDKRLPDNYFDLVFSVSALEHMPQEAEIIQGCIDDIDRVMNSNAHSLHCLDALLNKKHPVFHLPLQGLLGRAKNDILEETIMNDHDTYQVPINIYNQWKISKKIPYKEMVVCDIAAYWTSV